MAGPECPRFVPQAQLPADQPYEAFIARSRSVPTRDKLHDLFNGLIWLRYTPLKWRLNALQAAVIAAQGIGPRRGALRDALTLWDENGAWWPDADPELLRLLQQRDWIGLFVTHRERWATQGLHIVGHALLEQLSTAPRKGLTAHVLASSDPLVLTEANWAGKPFLPMPVPGIPGWWPDQGYPGFYEDAAVFRRPTVLKDVGKP